jgi:hypothetical protein
MRVARNFTIQADKLGEEKNAEGRRHGRVLTQGVECSVGEVLDLSASGMRIKTRFKLPNEGEVFPISVFTMDGPLAILGRIRWIRRRGLFLREAGVEFFDLGPRSKTVLSELAGRVAYNQSFSKAG